MSLSRRLLLLTLVVSLPFMGLLGWFTQSQLKSHLEESANSYRQQVSELVQRHFVGSLSARRQQLLQVRTALEQQQQGVLNFLLQQSQIDQRHIIVINHYGEAHQLLEEGRSPDSSGTILLEKLQSRLAAEAYQFERSGFALLEQEPLLMVELPLKHRQWRGIVLVESLTTAKMQPLVDLYSSLVAIKLGEAEAGSKGLPAMFGEPLQLQMSFDDRLFRHLNSDSITVVGVTLGVAALGLLFISGLQRRLLVAPVNEFAQRLHQVADWDQASPLPVYGKGEIKSIAATCNRLFTDRHQQGRQIDALLRAINDAVLVVNLQGRIEMVNPAAESLLQLAHVPIKHRALNELMNERSGQQLHRDLTELLQSNRISREGETRLDHNGAVLKYSVVRTLDGDGNTLGAVLVLRDMTQKRQLQQQLQLRAQRDNTTKLFNRQVFERELEALSQKPGQHAVCYMDLNRFKLINDSCGHTAGDRMLQDVATEMSKVVRSQDVLARIGGDEFGLIIHDSSALEVAKVLKNLSDRVQGITLYWDSGSYKVGISIGVAFFRGDQTPYETYKDAEIACTVTKTKGGEGQISFFDSLDQDLAHQRNAPMWAMKINDAIVNDDLVLFYQPIEPVNGVFNGKRKCEILLRIKEEGGRILAPGQFIAAAERFNLMPQVDRAVIRKSFEWLARNPHLWDTQVISINLSGTTLSSDGLVGYVEQMCETYRVPTHTVCFEVTETAALSNENHALEILHELRRRGFAFALDDFGSGFASYGYLRRLPVDYVKIDGCFVQNLANNSKDYAIVKSIHDVCRVMGIETVAEFVEDQQTLERLRHIGVTYAQGYGIGRPKDLATYEPMGSLEDALLKTFDDSAHSDLRH